MRWSVRRLAVVMALGASVTVFLGASRDARAQEVVESAAEARQQYQDGTRAFKDKRYSEAALHFEAAASFKASAVALYTAALAWDFASRPERAADAYARALEVPGLDAKQTNTSKERIATLERTLGTLVVTAPDGYKVQLDTLTEQTTPARLHAAPGVHVLNVRAPNKSVERRDVTLDTGKAVPLELKEEKKPPPPKPEPEPEPAPAKPAPAVEVVPPRLRDDQFWIARRVVGVGIAGVGLAGVAAGAILGTSAQGAKDAYDAAPSRPGFDHAKSLQTLTNVAFIAGGALAIGGIVLVALPGRSESRGARAPAVEVGVHPGGLVAAGVF